MAQPPTPSQVRVPRSRHAAPPAPSPLPPLLARLLLARRHHRLAAISRPACRNRHDTTFAPQAFPQLSPKACAVLNTPLKDCDPKTLELVFSTFAQHIGELMSPEAGVTDPQAILPNLWHRISTALGDTNADTSSSTTPQAVSATPADPVPADAPVASPHLPAPTTAPTTQWTNYAPRLSPLSLSGPPASDQPADPTITAAAPQRPPHIAAPSAPVVHQSRSFRSNKKSFARRHPRHARCCRALFPRGVRDGHQCLPPPWRLYYAACTGPP